MAIYIQYAILAITLIICLFNFRSLVNWFKPSFEDGLGTASYKKLTAFGLFSTDIYMIYSDKIVNQVTLYTHYSLLIAMLLVSAIITVENLLTLARIFKGGKSENENIKAGDNVIIEKV